MLNRSTTTESGPSSRLACGNSTTDGCCAAIGGGVRGCSTDGRCAPTVVYPAVVVPPQVAAFATAFESLPTAENKRSLPCAHRFPIAWPSALPSLTHGSLAGGGPGPPTKTSLLNLSFPWGAEALPLAMKARPRMRSISHFSVYGGSLRLPGGPTQGPVSMCLFGA